MNYRKECLRKCGCSLLVCFGVVGFFHMAGITLRVLADGRKRIMEFSE
jgi:hypothetical protein